MKKYKKYAGANENSLSRSEYFSWINNTNEGSSEEQSLINLEFFNYLYKTYGMILDIYAMDAGNIDGSDGDYESLDSKKIKNQYPQGFKNMVKKAKEMNTRLGIWMGPDGFGENDEEAEKRKELLVSLCRDDNFELFKFDRVCSDIREEKLKWFEETLIECRKYSKDLIALNHRLSLGDATKYTTTFLWEGLETYIDVHGVNRITAPHNRAYMFSRGFTPEYKRLTEDHGVCLSSSIDYFEDDLVYQAFNRSLILSPEIYGNPWFLMDSEYPKLARVFNLARTYRKDLRYGIPLGEEYGACAFSRGNDHRRFISTGNDKWEARTIKIALNENIGLKRCDKVVVSTHFPYEEFIGVYDYNDIALLRLDPFRATLIEVADLNYSSEYLTSCRYEVLHEKDSVVDKVNIVKSNGKIGVFRNGKIEEIEDSKVDVIMKEPIYLGSIEDEDTSTDKEFLFESAYFSIDNDNLELRTIRRSGESKIKEVNDARDAFFNQESYKRKGIVSSSVFDNDEYSVFDTKSKLYEGGHRVNGGCLRVDFGKIEEIDRIEIEYFDAEENPSWYFSKQIVKDNMEVSEDLRSFEKARLIGTEFVRMENFVYYISYKDKRLEQEGKRMKAVYEYHGNARYFRLPDQMDRIFSIKAFKKESEIKPSCPRLSNLFSPYELSKTNKVLKKTFNLTKLPSNPYLSIAIEGVTGNEGVTLTYEIDGKYIGAPNRAPQYPCNPFEYFVKKMDGYYTFFIDLDESMISKDINIYVQFKGNIVPVNVYLCDRNIPRKGEEMAILLKENNK